MKIKLDENLPDEIKGILSSLGHDVDTVKDESLAGSVDETIWTAAQNADRFLITQDLDFSDLRKYRPGTHAGILLIRLNEPNRRMLIQKTRSIFEEEDTSSWKGVVAVPATHKLRIIRHARQQSGRSPPGKGHGLAKGIHRDRRPPAQSPPTPAAVSPAARSGSTPGRRRRPRGS